jgi:hypothetical protein
MLYKLEVADLNLEQVRSLDYPVTMAVWHRPFFQRGGNSLWGTTTPRVVHRPPMFGAMVPMVSFK